jgi:hypothetical protein
MKPRSFLFAMFLLSAPAGSAAAPPPFSSLAPGQALPGDFHLITLPKIAHNKFSLVADDGTTVLRVDSDNSAGSVGIPITVSPVSDKERAGRATLEWRWKIDRLLEKADMDHKMGDDFPARVYVFFDVPLESLSFVDRGKIKIARMVSGADVPTAALCYVWDNQHRIGHTAWSPYTNRVRKVVLQSGPSNVGKWMSESRDVAADFREAFGFAAPAVTGVAVGNDSDNTDDHVTAWFGDVNFRK